MGLIEINFDFRTDTPEGRDPDAHSPALRAYHKYLWSKALPSGTIFTLDDTTPWAYLHHRSERGEFYLSSDTGNSSFRNMSRIAHIRSQIPDDEMSRFRTIMYSIGNMVIFPGRQIGGKWTINQARGCNRHVGDRSDLTLECIRLQYCSQPNPLAVPLQRYADFFGLFENFAGYVDFFLLNDMVTADYSAVKFFLPFIGFGRQSPHPDSVDAFRTYLQEATQFIAARNSRILGYSRWHEADKEAHSQKTARPLMSTS